MTTGRRTAGDEQTTDGTPAPPRYPEADDPVDNGLGRRDAGGPRRPWTTVLVIVVTVFVLAILVALHLSGAVGPGAH